jgi:hypothetical protein
MLVIRKNWTDIFPVPRPDRQPFFIFRYIGLFFDRKNPARHSRNQKEFLPTNE